MFTECLLCAGHCAGHSGKDSEMDKVTVLKELSTRQGRNTGFQSSTRAACVTGPAHISPGLSPHTLPSTAVLGPGGVQGVVCSRQGLMLFFLLLWVSQREAGWALQHASEGLLAVSAEAHPEDRRRQTATRDLLQAVGNVLEASLRDRSEEPAQANSSQVGVPAQMWTSC